MEHRHILNAPQIPETDGDQGWNQPDQPYKHMARIGALESSSLVHPVENTVIQGGPFPSSAPRLGGYSSSTHIGELTHNRPKNPGQARDPFPHQPVDRNSHTFPNNNLHHPSSTLSGHTVHKVDEAIRNQRTGLGSHKRKSPCVPQLSTSRNYDVGSSSNMQLPADPLHGKQNTKFYHTHRKYQTDYNANSLSSSVESTPRNVRSRAGVDLEQNSVRVRLSSDMLHQSFNSPSSDQTNLFRQSSNTPTTKLNRLISPAPHGVIIGSGPSFFNHDLNTLNALNHHSNGSAVSEDCSNNATANRITVPQNANCNVNQSTRGIQSGYDQRSAPTFSASSSNFHAGQVSASNEGLQMTAESYSSRHRRAVSNIRLLYGERNGRAGISSDRFILSTEQDLTAVNRFALYGFRNPFDQHRDMRLDVDNMSYEELLVLGERIGSVSTGLPGNLISKCLTEAIFCASDQFEDDGRCVICLEEYKHMDDVGNLKCGHDFHGGCIRKWLSMKNLCPICKSSAIDESNKGK